MAFFGIDLAPRGGVPFPREAILVTLLVHALLQKADAEEGTIASAKRLLHDSCIHSLIFFNLNRPKGTSYLMQFLNTMTPTKLMLIYRGYSYSAYQSKQMHSPEYNNLLANASFFVFLGMMLQQVVGFRLTH